MYRFGVSNILKIHGSDVRGVWTYWKLRNRCSWSLTRTLVEVSRKMFWLKRPETDSQNLLQGPHWSILLEMQTMLDTTTHAQMLNPSSEEQHQSYVVVRGSLPFLGSFLVHRQWILPLIDPSPEIVKKKCLNFFFLSWWILSVILVIDPIVTCVGRWQPWTEVIDALLVKKLIIDGLLDKNHRQYPSVIAEIHRSPPIPEIHRSARHHPLLWSRLVLVPKNLVFFGQIDDDTGCGKSGSRSRAIARSPSMTSVHGCQHPTHVTIGSMTRITDSIHQQIFFLNFFFLSFYLKQAWDFHIVFVLQIQNSFFVLRTRDEVKLVFSLFFLSFSLIIGTYTCRDSQQIK